MDEIVVLMKENGENFDLDWLEAKKIAEIIAEKINRAVKAGWDDADGYHVPSFEKNDPDEEEEAFNKFIEENCDTQVRVANEFTFYLG